MRKEYKLIPAESEKFKVPFYVVNNQSFVF